MNERQVDADQVRREHLENVDQRIQWAYLIAVLGGATALMLLVLILLDQVG